MSYEPVKEIAEHFQAGILNNFAGKISNILKTWKNDIDISYLYKYIGHVANVKTIWHKENSIDIREFYVNPHIENKPQNERKVISQVDEMNENHLLIQGMEGLGKSTFLRYLCIKEFEKAKRIPIFIELKKITTNLMDEIFTNLKNLHLYINEDIFEDIATKGKFILFLDAFDEIGKDLEASISKEIENLCRRYPKMSIVVSSRTNRSIDYMPELNTSYISPLKEEEYKDIIKKIVTDSYRQECIIEAIENNPEIKNIMQTPLITMLYVFAHENGSTDILTVVDFYNEIFRGVFIKHYEVKGPSKVEKKCKSFSYLDYKEVFCSFCYYCKIDYDLEVYSYDNFLGLASKALEEYAEIKGVKEKPEDYLADILDITCLILCEGEEYYFLHKTIQEFFCAKYISSVGEDGRKNFYIELLEDADLAVWFNWLIELNFLESLDEYLYLKYYKIPLINKTIGNIEDPETCIQNIIEFIQINHLHQISINHIGQKLFDSLNLTSFILNNVHYLISLANIPNSVHGFTNSLTFPQLENFWRHLYFRIKEEYKGIKNVVQGYETKSKKSISVLRKKK